MLAPSYLLFCLAIIYLLILQIISFFIYFRHKIAINQHQILTIFFLALFIRLIPTIFFPFGSEYDLTSFRWAGEQILEGIDIYWGLGVRHHFAFLPAYGILTAVILQISQATSIPFLILTKIPIIFFDSLIAVMVYLVRKNFRLSLLYALSPIPILLSAYFGQFDAIVLFFSLLGLYLVSQKRPLISGLALGLGTAFKPWALLFAPLIFFQQKSYIDRLYVAIGLIGPIGLITGIYKHLIPQANLKIMFGEIAVYESLVGWWGPSILVPSLSKLLALPKLSILLAQVFKFIAIILIFLLATPQNKLKKQPGIFHTGLLSILTIYIFSLGFGIQYMLWIFPFALICKDSFLKNYLLFTGSYYILFGALQILDYNFHSLKLPYTAYLFSSFLLWCFFARWGYRVYKRNNS